MDAYPGEWLLVNEAGYGWPEVLGVFSRLDLAQAAAASTHRAEQPVYVQVGNVVREAR